MAYHIKFVKNWKVRLLFSKVPWTILALLLLCTCFLPECDITADDFNLGSYDLWSKEVQLSWKEKTALKKLIGKSPQLYRDCVGST